MEFTTTERGQRMLIRNGHIYTFQKFLANEIQSWECTHRRKGQCKARVKVNANNEFLEQVNEHTHPPSNTKVEVAKVKSAMKRRAETTNDTCQQILGVELQRISQSAAVQLPQILHIKRCIRSQRQVRNILANPQRREDIPILPQQYQLTNNGDQFLLFDSGVEVADRIFIFATQQGLDLLANNEHWFKYIY
jgi:hypothetical protein